MKMYGYHAMSYLNQWLRNDSRWHFSLNSNNDRSNKLQTIKEVATHYRVARNWRTVSKDPERYGPILDFLQSCEGVPADDVAGFVISTADSLKQLNDDRNVLSMTSKLLWVKFKSPIVIYDKQAKDALGVRGDDYSKFLDVWKRRFLEEKGAISLACRSLYKGVDFCVRPDLKLDELEEITSSEFFMERVFDLKLWTDGGTTP